MVCQEPTSTPTGMSRPRPFADSSAATALLSKASAPMPYTVSVGITTSRPPLRAPTAEAIPAARASASAQLNTSATDSPLPRGHEPGPPREILVRPDVVEMPGALDQFDGQRRGAVIVLDGEEAAGAQPSSGEVRHRADHRHSVRSPKQRMRWI